MTHSHLALERLGLSMQIEQQTTWLQPARGRLFAGSPFACFHNGSAATPDDVLTTGGYPPQR